MPAALQLSAHHYLERPKASQSSSGQGTLATRTVKADPKAPSKIEDVAKKTKWDARAEYAKALGLGFVAVVASTAAILFALTLVNVVVAVVGLVLLPLYFLCPPVAYIIALALFLVLAYFAVFAVKHVIFDPIADRAIHHAVRGDQLSLQARQMTAKA